MTETDFTKAEELKLAGMSSEAVLAVESALMPPPNILRLGQAGFDGRKAMIIFNYDHGDDDTTDNFDDSEVANNSCPIEKATNQFVVAQTILSRGKAGRRVDWRVLAEILKRRLGAKGTKREVKDAIIGINSNIQKAVKENDDLLVWEDGFVVRRI